MFDALSDKLQKTFRNLRGLGKISETNVAESLREVRMALLDADVNFKVAKQFIARVKDKALGEEVIASIQPGQQIVKIINDEMIGLLGTERSNLDLPRGFDQPLSLMMCGLHGSGKPPPAANSPACSPPRDVNRCSSVRIFIGPPRWTRSKPWPSSLICRAF